MKASTTETPGFLTIILSRRNLLALLAKLDGYHPGSAMTIRGGDEAPNIQVRVEEDFVHYANRPFGEMHELTEGRILDV